MSNYLLNETFKLYHGGIYNGKVVFKDDYIEILPVDKKSRVQLKEIPLEEAERFHHVINLKQIHKELSFYKNCKWENEKEILENGQIYNKYLRYKHEEIEAILWARRKLDYENFSNIDVLTSEGKVIGFIMTGRLVMEILIKEGYEKVTPLDKYNNLSKNKYGIDYLGNQFVKTRDGVDLATDVYLPYKLEKNQKVPTIVIRTCYGKESHINETAHWVNRGYAVVIQDVRGRSNSDGELFVFNYERDDAYDLFDWIVKQEWADGNIGMWGASYLGYTTTSAATANHPNLKTAISEVNVGSPFYDTARRGGTVCSWPLLSWSLAQSVGNRINFDIFRGITADPEEICKMRPIKDIPKMVIEKESKIWDRWAEHYYYDDFWKSSDNTEHAQNIKIPMLIMSGWYDGDGLGVQETWKFLEKYNVPGRRIILGPWPHELNSFRDCMDLEFGNNAIDYDFDTRIVRWFDHYLKNIENGEDKLPRARYYVVGENEWRTSECWNPKESSLINFYFSNNGKAFLKPDVEEAYDEYIYDPDNPIGISNSSEPYICNEIQKRQDCVCYDTDFLEEDIIIAGNIYSEFYAASTAVDTDFVIRVSDVDNEGVARKISDNVIRAEFRNGFSKPEKLEPGKVEKFKIEMNFNGYMFKKGHKIRFDVTSSNYLEFFPNSNTGINPYYDPKPIIAKQRIYHGGKYPSHVKLPII